MWHVLFGGTEGLLQGAGELAGIGVPKRIAQAGACGSGEQKGGRLGQPLAHATLARAEVYAH